MLNISYSLKMWNIFISIISHFDLLAGSYFTLIYNGVVGVIGSCVFQTQCINPWIHVENQGFMVFAFYIIPQDWVSITYFRLKEVRRTAEHSLVVLPWDTFSVSEFNLCDITCYHFIILGCYPDQSVVSSPLLQMCADEKAERVYFALLKWHLSSVFEVTLLNV